MNEMTMPKPVRLAPHSNWTEKFGLPSEPVSLEDTISPEFFALEQEAIFRRSWLYVGREERLNGPGAFFTREFETLKKSVLLTREKTGQIRAYHNVCPHRGNTLVWDTHASQEMSGRCRRFVCKFHGIGFGLDGKVEVLTDKTAWLDGQGERLELATVPCEVWNGFIFVNFTPGGPRETLREFIGEEFWTGFDGYPFGEMTEWHSFRADADANWKALYDGFSEVYHAATTHSVPFAMGPAESYPVGASHFNDIALVGKHRSYLAKRAAKMPFNFPYQEATNSIAIGPQYRFPEKCETLPPAANPIGMEHWGNSTTMLWPNLYIQFYSPGWYVTYRMMPLAANKMRFEVDTYMPKARNFSEALAQKSCLLQFLEAALQDFSLLEAQQKGLECRAFEKYPLTDQEIMLRQFHKQVHDAVAEYQETLQA